MSESADREDRVTEEGAGLRFAFEDSVGRCGGATLFAVVIGASFRGGSVGWLCEVHVFWVGFLRVFAGSVSVSVLVDEGEGAVLGG